MTRGEPVELRPAGQELFDGWRADLEQRLRAEDDHPVLLCRWWSGWRRWGQVEGWAAWAQRPRGPETSGQMSQMMGHVAEMQKHMSEVMGRAPSEKKAERG